jgi:DNA-binding MarR family transcriptional regulator
LVDERDLDRRRGHRPDERAACDAGAEDGDLLHGGLLVWEQLFSAKLSTMSDAMTNILATRSRDEALLTWVRLVRLAKKGRSSVGSPIKAAGLSDGTFDLLVDIGEHPGTSQQACADRVGVTKGNVTQHLQRLERRGLVRRDPAGRRNDLFLTESGKLLLSSVLAAHDEGMHELLGVLSAEDLRSLRAILRKLDRGLRERAHGLDQEQRDRRETR